MEQLTGGAGSAGASARREYERRKDKRATRIREAHPRLGSLLLALTDDPQSTQAWAVGAQGEEILGKRLDTLTGTGCYLLHDRRIPGTTANIDHIVVCPSGVVVIDAKKHKGRPSLRVEGGLLSPRVETLRFGSRDRTAMVDGVHKQVEHVRSALAVAGLRDVPVRGMLCFVAADWPLIGGAFMINGIHVLWPKKAIHYLSEAGPVDDSSARHIRNILARSFLPA